MTILDKSYYLHDDVVFLSKDLIGKYLFTCIDGCLTGGMIIETEAYKGPEDKASHAYGNRRTPRNEAMYHAGGIAYVYLCYGIHSLFNIVTNKENIPHAILIRAIKPVVGLEHMLNRRGKKQNSPSLTAGPGSLSVALGITTKHNRITLSGPEIWIESHGKVSEENIVATPRIGIDYAGEDALLPWRFIIHSKI